MILSFDDIKKILKENPSKSLITKAINKSKDLRCHLYGENLENIVSQIKGFEREEVTALRKKFSKSNKDLFERIGRPIDKVFSALGGSVYYNLSDSKDKLASNISSNVRNGYSLKSWVYNFWKPHFLDDPNGIVMLEIDSVGNVYPTYKSIFCIYDYLPVGSSLEYVVFKLSKEDKKQANISDDDSIYFRLIDDAKDYLIKQTGDDFSVVENATFINFFGKVPAILNSDIVSSSCDGLRLSLYDTIDEVASNFFEKRSIKKVHDFFHAFPKYWEYADDCKTCKGTRNVNGEKCPSCNGSGKSVMSSVAETKILSYPETKDDAVVTPNVAGYVSPDSTYYEISKDELEKMEEQMMFTIWGSTLTKNNTVEKTATQVFIDVQPVNDVLSKISEMAEKRHKFIIDNIIKLKIQANYTGASISYGRRYVIESPDAIWEKYSDARKSGSPISVLDELLIEYFEAKYQTDPIGLAIAKKLMYVEPFVHNTIIEVNTFQVESFEKLKKNYYGDWLQNINDAEIIVNDIAWLKDSLKRYCIDKSNEDNNNKDNTPLAVKLGVGGTQSLQLILSDATINPESKKNTLQILFGITEEDAIKMTTTASIPKPAPLV
jgi:hypothetical protein